MRITAKILILMSIINIFFTSFGAAETIVYEESENFYITKGVTGRHIKKLTSTGWYNINYIEVDLNEEGVGLRVLSNKDPKTKSTVLKMAKENEDVVAAINADFFTTYTSTTSPEGMLIKDGALLTNPSNDPSYATFTLDNNLLAGINHYTYEIKVTSKRTNDCSNILFYNKNGDPMYLKLYDRGYGETSPGSLDFGYEVVVEDGVVTQVLSNAEGVTIPENGYVLHNSLKHSLFLSENFYIGDEVELDITVSPEIDNIKEAVGGGTILLKDGEISNFTLSNVLNPMTAVGIDKTGKKLVLFTVDGRQTHSRGMNFTQIASFLKSLGYYNAMSFDGGGSTTMVASKNGDELKNLNNQSSYRSIINSIGITAKREKGDFYGMEIELSKEKAFPNEPVTVNIISSYDEYGNHFDITNKKIKYKADGNGKFKGNVFYPEKSGEVKITVTIDDVKRTKNLKVLPELTELKADVSSFEITETPQKVSFYLENDEKYRLDLKEDDLEFEFEKAEGTIKNGELVLTKAKKGRVIAIYNDFTLEIPITDKEVINEEKDIFERTAVEEGFEFAVFGVNNHGDCLYTNYVTGKRNKIANECDLVAFKAIPTEVTIPSIRVTNYGREDTEHSLFIKLDNSKGSITSTKPEQWDWLLNVFKKGVSQKNIFINMPLDLSRASDTKEIEILTDVLKDNLQGKNIFIITYSDDNTYTLKEGIRYITVAEIPMLTDENPMEAIGKLKYASFTIIDGEVYFEFKPVIN